jgi:drug/metabolite transporter (DMT)-like permease
MRSWIPVGLCILFTVYGQLIIKWRMLTFGKLPDDLPAKILVLVRNLFDPWIFSGLFAAGVAAVSWMAAMTVLPITKAYPFMSLAFIFVLIFGSKLFGEPVTWPKIAGLVLVVAGLLVGVRG